uniref:OSJNBb0039L24.16 protein n=2 Tax=Oryza sativa TaxID=4530 RepID=Q7XMK2_ORYSJ|nr:OSJNBb0039L24.16 [Oryza sativa Japonica Group]CAH67457.1 OSIGBa0159I10.2 [Oryza sativa]
MAMAMAHVLVFPAPAQGRLGASAGGGAPQPPRLRFLSMLDGLPDVDQLLIDGLLRKARAFLLNMTISMEHQALTRLARHMHDLFAIGPLHRQSWRCGPLLGPLLAAAVEGRNCQEREAYGGHDDDDDEDMGGTPRGRMDQWRESEMAAVQRMDEAVQLGQPRPCPRRPQATTHLPAPRRRGGEEARWSGGR